MSKIMMKILQVTSTKKSHLNAQLEKCTLCAFEDIINTANSWEGELILKRLYSKSRFM